MEVGVHPRFKNRDAAELTELRRVGLEVERARDQHVEAGLAGGLHQVGAADGPKLGTDEDAGAARGVALAVAALGADPLAGPRPQGCERDAVAPIFLLDAGCFRHQVLVKRA